MYKINARLHVFLFYKKNLSSSFPNGKEAKDSSFRKRSKAEEGIDVGLHHPLLLGQAIW